MTARWLAAGGIVVLAALLLLWRAVRSSDLPAPRASAPSPAPAPAIVPALPAPDAAIAAATGPVKLDPQSDEFFYQFDEVVPRKLTRNAARCYEGRQGSLHRNQKLSLRMKVRIAAGQVTVHDVAVKQSTLRDAALEACFLDAIRGSTWRNDALPDWEQEDQLVIRPERGMKKYWRSNVDYVGGTAPARPRNDGRRHGNRRGSNGGAGRSSRR